MNLKKKKEEATPFDKNVTTEDIIQSLENQEKPQKVNNNIYYVTIIDVESGNHRLVTHGLECVRYFDKTDKTVYLKNEKTKFITQYPDVDTNQIPKSKISNILSRMNELENLIESEYEEDSEEFNVRDLEAEYVRLKKDLRLLLYGDRTSFWGSMNGRPWLILFRSGSDFFAGNVNADASTIHTISNERKSTNRNTITNRSLAYGGKSIAITIGIVFIIATFVAASLSGYAVWKYQQNNNDFLDKLNENELALLVRECRINLDQEKEDIKRSVIDGVSEAIIQNNERNDPRGSGG